MKSRVPLPVNTALERMNLPPVAETVAVAVSAASVPRRLLQDYRPLAECLEWKVAQAHWEDAGLFPFVESEVPYLINNSGRLSADVALVFFAHCDEAEALPPEFSVLEVGAGTGLFARYFLDHFRILCNEHGKDYYERLTYVVTDRSRLTVSQWAERDLFDAHEQHVVAASFDPTLRDDFRFKGQLRAIFCNYVLDVMPSTVVRAGSTGPEELCVRTHLMTDLSLIRQYTIRTPDEINALAASQRLPDLLEIAQLLPLFEFETAFRPISREPVCFVREALDFTAGGGEMLLNYGAVQTMHRFMDVIDRDGFVLISDYGPVQKDQIKDYCSLQRFGSTVAFGINFPLLEYHCAHTNILIAKPAGDDERGIHTRLLSHLDLSHTNEAFQQAFAADAQVNHEARLEQARAHANAGRLHEALDAYREAVTCNPRCWNVIGEAGEFIGLQLRNFEAALEMLRVAVALNPCYSSWLWNILGDALYCLERYQDAHEAYLQAARINPEDVRTNLNLGHTFSHFGHLTDALQAIAKGLAGDCHEAYRSRLIEKQRHILDLVSTRRQAELEALMLRARRFQMI
jgi:tetratricopeptide (TPR) repeat protein